MEEDGHDNKFEICQTKPLNLVEPPQVTILSMGFKQSKYTYRLSKCISH